MKEYRQKSKKINPALKKFDEISRNKTAAVDNFIELVDEISKIEFKSVVFRIVGDDEYRPGIRISSEEHSVFFNPKSKMFFLREDVFWAHK